jgi:hypothetical protein
MSHRCTQMDTDQRMPIASSSSASVSIGVDLWLSLLLLFVMCFVCGKQAAEKN